mgnify:CR=1 FL=1
MVLDNDGEFGVSGTYDFGVDAELPSTDVSLLNASFQPVLPDVEALTSGAFSLAPTMATFWVTSPLSAWARSTSLLMQCSVRTLVASAASLH